VDWVDIEKLPSWTPLRSICAAPLLMSDCLYQIGTNQYAIALPVDSTLCEHLPGNPFVTVVYWATTADGARLCALRDESAIVDRRELPPAELLLGTSGRYGELLGTEKCRRIGRTCEYALYSSKTGKLLYKVLECGDVKYCFLDNKVRNDEMPYAIEITLR
jgi:hypothetical protein